MMSSTDHILVPLAEVAEIQGGIQKKPDRAPRENKYPFLRVANVTASGLDLADVHEVELFEGELGKYRLNYGDLLVVEGNGSAAQIGRAAVWDGSIASCVHQNHLIRVRPTDDLLPQFLGYVWNSPAVRRRLTQVSSSTSGLHTLSVAKLKRISVPVPSVSDQARIIEFLDRQFSQLAAVDSYVKSVALRSVAIRKSLLQSAFTGDLTSLGYA